MSDSLVPILKHEDGEGSRRDSKNLEVKFAVDIREHSKDEVSALDTPQEVTAQLARGSLLATLNKKKSSEHYYFYDPDTSSFCIMKSPTSKSFKKVAIKTITHVVAGKASPTFQLDHWSHIAPWLCFSVFTKKTRYDLVAESSDVAQLWVSGLKQLLRSVEAAEKEVEIRQNWIKDVFEIAADGDKYLKSDRCASILINILPWLRVEVVQLKIKNTVEKRSLSEKKQYSRLNIHGESRESQSSIEGKKNESAVEEPEEEAAIQEEQVDTENDGGDDDKTANDAKADDEDATSSDEVSDSTAIKVVSGDTQENDDDATKESQESTSDPSLDKNKAGMDTPTDSSENVSDGRENQETPPMLSQIATPIDGLDFDEFYSLFRKLTARRELYFILSQYSDTPGGVVLTRRGLASFLKLEQQAMSVNESKLSQFIAMYEPIALHKDAQVLGQDGMATLLRSEYSLSASAQSQDMTHGLNHYYIMSSFNTYISHDQVSSPCTTEVYIKALNAGCRCVEIDVWDSSDDGSKRPIVMHGHTRTEQIELKDALQAISDNAFTHTDFPLILIIEMHCNIENQSHAATMMTSVLGADKVVSVSAEEYAKLSQADALPSPADLRNKIVIISQRTGLECFQQGTSEFVDEHDEYAFYKEVKKRRDPRYRRKSEAPHDKQPDKIEIGHDWSKIVFMPHHLHSNQTVPASQSGQQLHSLVSINEKTAMKMVTETPTHLLEMCRTGLVRVFPADSRVDSDNMDILPFITCGVQIVSCNLQTDDHHLRIMRSMFEGTPGYLLKPSFLRHKMELVDDDWQFDPQADVFTEIAPRRLTITVISGHQLFPPPPSLKAKTGSKTAKSPRKRSSMQGALVDPYVAVELSGVKADNQLFKTKAIDNNSFDPYWNQSITMEVHCPPLAILTLTVLDDDVINENYLGFASFRFKDLKPGYHTVPLRHRDYSLQKGASLFVHVTYDEDTAEVPANEGLVTHHDEFHDANAADGMPSKQKKTKKKSQKSEQSSEESHGVFDHIDAEKAIIIPHNKLASTGFSQLEPSLETYRARLSDAVIALEKCQSSWTLLAETVGAHLVKSHRLEEVAECLKRTLTSESFSFDVESLGQGVRIVPDKDHNKEIMKKTVEAVLEHSQCADSFELQYSDYLDIFTTVISEINQFIKDNSDANSKLLPTLRQLQLQSCQFTHSHEWVIRQIALVKSACLSACKQSLFARA